MSYIFYTSKIDDVQPVVFMNEINMTLDEAKHELEGKRYSKEVVLRIESTGFGFTTSAATGRISEIYKPVSPKHDVNKS